MRKLPHHLPKRKPVPVKMKSRYILMKPTVRQCDPTKFVAGHNKQQHRGVYRIEKKEKLAEERRREKKQRDDGKKKKKLRKVEDAREN